MTRVGVLAVAICLTACGGAKESGPSYPSWEGDLPQPAAPVWLVGLDGATWDLVRPLLDRGELPTFARLMDEGAYGTLLSEEPTISPAIWATMVSGVPREVHGVDNLLDDFNNVPVGAPEDVSMAIGWDFVLGAGETAVASFTLSETDDSAGAFTIRQVDLDSGNAIYFWSDLDISTAVPEPGTLLLFSLGLVGFGLSKKRKAAA